MYVMVTMYNMDGYTDGRKDGWMYVGVRGHLSARAVVCLWSWVSVDVCMHTVCHVLWRTAYMNTLYCDIRCRLRIHVLSGLSTQCVI